VRHTDDPARRVARTEDLLHHVERRAQPQLGAQRHQGVQVRHEPRLPDVAEAARLDAARHGLRLEVRVHAEFVDHVADGDAALRTHVRLAVHDDRRARHRRDDARRRADDDVLRPPVVRAADVEQAVDVRLKRPYAPAYGIRVAEQLIGRLAAVALE
jgi:hypothetical protein